MENFIINTIGMKNIVDAAPSNCKVVLASTCKATNPEIVYGASKLIAEDSPERRRQCSKIF